MSSTEISADPHAGTLRSPRFWLAPVVVVTAVMAALAALYIGSMINPADNLHKFPVAIVNQDVGDVLPVRISSATSAPRSPPPSPPGSIRKRSICNRSGSPRRPRDSIRAGSTGRS